jgi:hypothetical protein
VTLAESWLYYLIDHEFIWLPLDGKVPDRGDLTIQSQKGTFSLVWCPIGFAVVTAIHNGCKFNAG